MRGLAMMDSLKGVYEWAKRQLLDHMTALFSVAGGSAVLLIVPTAFHLVLLAWVGCQLATTGVRRRQLRAAGIDPQSARHVLFVDVGVTLLLACAALVVATPYAAGIALTIVCIKVWSFQTTHSSVVAGAQNVPCATALVLETQPLNTIHTRMRTLLNEHAETTSRRWDRARESGSITTILVAFIVATSILMIVLTLVFDTPASTGLDRIAAFPGISRTTTTTSTTTTSAPARSTSQTTTVAGTATTTSTTTPTTTTATTTTATTATATTTTTYDGEDSANPDCSLEQNLATLGIGMPADLAISMRAFHDQGPGGAPGLIGCLDTPVSTSTGAWYQLGKRGGTTVSITITSHDGVTAIAFDGIEQLKSLLDQGSLARLWPKKLADLPQETLTGIYIQVVELVTGPTIRAQYNAPGPEQPRPRVDLDVPSSTWLLNAIERHGNWLWPTDDGNGLLFSDEPGGEPMRADAFDGGTGDPKRSWSPAEIEALLALPR